MTVGAIETDAFFPHSPPVVWAALTDAEQLSEWLAPTNFHPVVGHRFTFDMGEWGLTHCEVLELKPMERLVYSWQSGDVDTTVTWTLEPQGRGTRLFLRHDGFDLDSPLAERAYRGMGGGWRSVVVPALGRHLRNVEGDGNDAIIPGAQPR